MQEQSSNSHEKKFYWWEIILLVILVPSFYLLLCYIVLSSEYDYPHVKLAFLFDSELVPYLVVLGFDVAWLIFICFSSFISKRTKVYLSLIIYILSAVAITDIFCINMWQSMMV